jgi:hypothetical protein
MKALPGRQKHLARDSGHSLFPQRLLKERK